MIAHEQGLLAARDEFEQMIAYVRGAGERGEAMHEVEKSLWERVLRMGLEALKGYVQSQGDGDMGESLTLSDGQVVKRLEERHSRRYVSIFGELVIERVVYGTREKQKIEAVPLDARLELPESDFSYVLQDWDQSQCVEQSYDGGRKSIAKILKLKQSVRTLEHMNQQMAEGVEAFQESQESPPPAEEGEVVVVMADCKGIPMRRGEDDVKPKKHRKKGEKKNKKRMACVGASYTVDRFARTPEQVMDDVVRQEVEVKRPKPQHKRLRAELSREGNDTPVKSKEVVFDWLEDEIKQRNPQGKKEVVFVSDGEQALEQRADEHFEGFSFVSVLDLMHATPRLWEAAYCFHEEGSKAAESFVEDRLLRLLKGEVGSVIAGLRQMATKRELGGREGKTIAEVTNYYQRHRERMKYDEYLAAGYPIGTGPVEGACRNLIKDRFERTGMRWTVEGAQAMLDLRATYLNGDWEAFCEYRIELETQRLYPYRDTISNAQWN